MIVICQGCSADLGVKCPHCASTNVEVEFHNHVLDFVLATVFEADTPYGEIYTCDGCGRTFSRREGGVSHGWCHECYQHQIDSMVEADREYSSGVNERE